MYFDSSIATSLRYLLWKWENGPGWNFTSTFVCLDHDEWICWSLQYIFVRSCVYRVNELQCIEGMYFDSSIAISILYLFRKWENGPGWNFTSTYVCLHHDEWICWSLQYIFIRSCVYRVNELQCIEGMYFDSSIAISILYLLWKWENGPGWNFTSTYVCLHHDEWICWSLQYIFIRSCVYRVNELQCIEGMYFDSSIATSILYLLWKWENGPGWNFTSTFVCLDFSVP